MIDFGIVFGALALGVVVVVMPVAAWRLVFGWSEPKQTRCTKYRKRGNKLAR